MAVDAYGNEINEDLIKIQKGDEVRIVQDGDKFTIETLGGDKLSGATTSGFTGKKNARKFVFSSEDAARSYLGVRGYFVEGEKPAEEPVDTVLDEQTNETLEDVEEIADVTFGGGQEEGEVDPTDDIANYFDNTATSVNSAAAQQQNQASALATSVGEAEDEAISFMTSGMGSNILNPGGAQGLLAGDDEDEFDPFNRRKTLIGA